MVSIPFFFHPETEEAQAMAMLYSSPSGSSAIARRVVICDASVG